MALITYYAFLSKAYGICRPYMAQEVSGNDFIKQIGEEKVLYDKFQDDELLISYYRDIRYLYIKTNYLLDMNM